MVSFLCIFEIISDDNEVSIPRATWLTVKIMIGVTSAGAGSLTYWRQHDRLLVNAHDDKLEYET